MSASTRTGQEQEDDDDLRLFLWSGLLGQSPTKCQNEQEQEEPMGQPALEPQGSNHDCLHKQTECDTPVPPPLDQITVTTSSSLTQLEDEEEDKGGGEYHHHHHQVRQGPLHKTSSHHQDADDCSSISCCLEEEEQLPKKEDEPRPDWNHVSPSRSIFQDYWTAQGCEQGKCPIVFRLPKSFPLLLENGPATTNNDNHQKDPESRTVQEPPSPKQANDSLAPSSPPSTAKPRRSIFGLTNSTPSTKVPPSTVVPSSLTSLLLLEGGSHHHPTALAGAPLDAPVKTTVSSPSLLHYPSERIQDLRKTMSTSQLDPRVPRPSALRRTGRYSSTGQVEVRRIKPPVLTRSPSVVTFRDQVEVAVVPAASSALTEQWAADGWSNWFA